MEAVYHINWSRLVALLLPTFLRKPISRLWIGCLLHPLETAHGSFMDFCEKSRYKLAHNSQICYLQAVVNDLFDPEIRGIRIKNAVIVPPLWLYEPEENKPIWLFEATEEGAVFLREESQIRGDGADFLVLLPQRLRPGDPTAREAFETSLKANINYYKLFVKNYNLKWEKEIN